MAKKYFITSLTLLILLVLSGGHVFYGKAAPMPGSDSPSLIDANVWEALTASPTREVSIVVSLRPEDDGGPELAIDAQFRLEKMLHLLGEKGGVHNVQAFYGANVIKITGGLDVLRLLEDWPELESVSLFESGETWELQAESALRSEELNASGLINGKVTAANGGTPLPDIRVTAFRLVEGVTWEVAGNALTDASGEYTVSSLASGFYRAKFEDQAGDYATQYFDNKSTFGQATNFNVTDGQVTPNINAALALAGKISGTVTQVGGGELKDIAVSAWTNAGGTWQFVSSAVSGSNGVYTIGSLPSGTYRVRFADIYSPPRYLVQWYDGKLAVDDAQDILVAAETTVSGINAAMGSYGSITGNVKADDGTTNLENIYVDVYRYDDGVWEWFGYDTTDASGNYEVFGLETGDVRVGFSDPLDQFAAEFYNNKPDLNSADNVAVSLSNVTTDINAELLLISDVVTFAKQTNGEDVENAPGPYIAVGDSVNWTYIITNNSDGSFTFSIVDDPAVMISCPTNVLLSGESTTCTASGTAVEGQFTNMATVTVTPPGDLIPFDIQDISHYFGVIESKLFLPLIMR